MNHSFKFIVNPNVTARVEITSFLQYCILKNTLSRFTSNNIKSLKDNRNPVLFSMCIEHIDPDISFTKYIQMTQDEKDTLKQKILKKGSVSLFFDAISKSVYKGIFKDRKFLDLLDSNDPDYYTVDDLYVIFMFNITAERYLSTYIPKNSNEVCYIDMYTDGDEDTDICYDDGCITFDIIKPGHEDNEYQKECNKIVNSIDKNVDVQKLKNNGYIENTYNEFCVYTEDPTIIHKVLMNNQSIINKMVFDIEYLNCKLNPTCLDNFDIFIELQSSIANVINSSEFMKKKAKDNLAVLNDLFN